MCTAQSEQCESGCDRCWLRAKQDRIIALAEAKGISEDLVISYMHPGCPTIRELRPYLWPQWEAAIDSAISYLART